MRWSSVRWTRRAPAWVTIVSEPTSTAELLELLRDLARTERLEGHERAALRRAAAELERLQPGNLATRSEYRAVEVDSGYAGPARSTRAAAVAGLQQSLYHDVQQSLYHDVAERRMEHRTVVESDWRPTHV